MGESAEGGDGRGLPRVAIEVVASLLLAGIGAAAIWDSLRIGAGWAEDGPQSGYFPFWLGLFLVLASLGTLVQAVRAAVAGVGEGIFAAWPQLRMVGSVLLPAVVYVALIPFLGLYVASVLLEAYLMMALGGFSWWVAVPTGLGVAVATFLVFETWFLVALPKGPVEDWLGY